MGETPQQNGSRRAGWLRAPALRLGLIVHALLACAALALLMALAMPRYGVSFADIGAMIAATPRGGAPVLVSETTPVTLRGGGNSLAVSASSLVNDHDPPGGPPAVRAFYAGRDRIAAIADTPGATLAFSANGERHTLSLARRAATLADLPADVWLLIAQGVAIGALGAWMWVSAPARCCKRCRRSTSSARTFAPRRCR